MPEFTNSDSSKGHSKLTSSAEAKSASNRRRRRNPIVAKCVKCCSIDSKKVPMGPCEVVQESTTSCGCVANHIAAQKNVKYSTAVVDKRSRSRTTFTKKDSHHSFDPSKQSNGILRRFFQWLRALLPLKREKKGKIGQEHKSKYFAKSTGKPKKRTPHNGRHRYP